MAAALVLNAFQSNLVFFFTPSQVAAKEAPQGRPFRIGGLVEAGSLQRDPQLADVHVRRDRHRADAFPSSYTGLLPDLFKEGKGVVAQGSLRCRRHVPRHRSAGEARRELHAARSRAAALDQAHKHRRDGDAEPDRAARRRNAMIPELGHFALILALLVALAQGVVPLSARRAATPR